MSAIPFIGPVVQFLEFSVGHIGAAEGRWNNQKNSPSGAQNNFSQKVKTQHMLAYYFSGPFLLFHNFF